jgi:hypothetical protein
VVGAQGGIVEGGGEGEGQKRREGGEGAGGGARRTFRLMNAR